MRKSDDRRRRLGSQRAKAASPWSRIATKTVAHIAQSFADARQAAAPSVSTEGKAAAAQADEGADGQKRKHAHDNTGDSAAGERLPIGEAGGLDRRLRTDAWD